MMIFLSLLSAFNRRMCCDCVRVVQSNLTALYLFFLFLFLFVMCVYILCKEERKFTKSEDENIFSERLLPCVCLFLSAVSMTNPLFLFLRVGSKIQNNRRDFDFPPYILFVLYRNTYKTHTLLPLS